MLSWVLVLGDMQKTNANVSELFLLEDRLFREMKCEWISDAWITVMFAIYDWNQNGAVEVEEVLKFVQVNGTLSMTMMYEKGLAWKVKDSVWKRFQIEKTLKKVEGGSR